MRAGALWLLFISVAASAADFKVKVIDPQSAAVSGAQVSVFAKRADVPIGEAITSAEGMATFGELKAGETSSDTYRIQVLAAGFAPQTESVPAQSDLVTIQLHLATASETVVVTATKNPTLAEETGASISTLESGQLETMQPITADDAVRFLPGAVINTAGQRGGISSLFVRGGESTYNKVIVDGIAVDNPGETFDFGTLPLTEADRMEFLRGAQSTLYGSDAMTSVVQIWTRTGSTRVPELRFSADGGNFSTANGYASFSGARGKFDYNLFGDQFNTNGFGVNDAYSDSLEGVNAGVAITDHAALRVRVRHSNNHTGVPGEWNFNGDPLLAPDPSETAQLNSLIGSTELTIASPSGWQHRLTAFDSLYRYNDINLNSNPASYDYFPGHTYNDINRVGFEYQGDYSERSWAHSTFGYRLENEVGFVGEVGSQTFGQRLEQDAYFQQQVTWRSLSAVGGGRFVHNSLFGNTGVPRVGLSFLALRGGEFFSGTRLRFSYAQGFMEPALYQTFANLPFYAANPGLLPERTRAFEAGFEQKIMNGKWAFSAIYFHNIFHDQIEYGTNQETYQAFPPGSLGEFFNVQKSLAHGAEVEVQGKVGKRVLVDTAYTYLSTQYLEAPLCTSANFCDPIYQAGNPLLRRPKHSATTLLSYLGTKWSANLAGSFVGPRPDSDFDGLGINHAAGYVRVDLGGWYAVTSRVTAYANMQNALDRRYNEVVGYPALPVNFRAGFRFRIGGE